MALDPYTLSQIKDRQGLQDYIDSFQYMERDELKQYTDVLAASFTPHADGFVINAVDVGNRPTISVTTTPIVITPSGFGGGSYNLLKTSTVDPSRANPLIVADITGSKPSVSINQTCELEIDIVVQGEWGNGVSLCAEVYQWDGVSAWVPMLSGKQSIDCDLGRSGADVTVSMTDRNIVTATTDPILAVALASSANTTLELKFLNFGVRYVPMTIGRYGTL